jgi:ketosteroid isomerase-like protein
MDGEFVERFAKEWVAAWNSHDLERILSHYADDVSFSSPHVIDRLGKATGEVNGEAELRDYWGRGLAGASDVHFTVEDVRSSVDTVVINYRNQHGALVAEVLRFSDGLVSWGCAAYAEHP